MKKIENAETMKNIAGGQEVIVYDKDGKTTYTCSDGVVMAKCH